MIHAYGHGLYIVLKLIFRILALVNIILSTLDSHIDLGTWFCIRDQIYCIIFSSFTMVRRVGLRRIDFRNAREKFNFKHSSFRNVIERAFGVRKNQWTILDRMPSYNFNVQIAVVIATIGIHNFLRWAGCVDEAFATVEMDLNAAEVELQDEQEEITAEMNAPKMQRYE